MPARAKNLPFARTSTTGREPPKHRPFEQQIWAASGPTGLISTAKWKSAPADAAEHLVEGRTALVVAHRQATIERMGLRLFFGRGQIVEN